MNQAPLPFQGQKRFFKKEFQNIIRNFDDTYLFVDLFGGSGLLSHFVLDILPNAKVIYNDYDGYMQRLNHILHTNNLLKKIDKIMKDAGIVNKQLVSKKVKDKVLKLLQKSDKEGYVDYLTISNNILFSMKYCSSLDEITKKTFYNNVKTKLYDELSVVDYLKNADITSVDWQILYNKYKNHKRVVFIADPPYLFTDVSGYSKIKSQNKSNPALLDVLKIFTSNSVIYFTSNKSMVMDFVEWGKQYGLIDFFSGSMVFKRENYPSLNRKYTDILIYKKI